MDKNKQVFKTKDICRYYRVSRQAVHQWISKGKFPKPHKTPGGHNYWLYDEIMNYILGQEGVNE